MSLNGLYLTADVKYVNVKPYVPIIFSTLSFVDVICVIRVPSDILDWYTCMLSVK